MSVFAAAYQNLLKKQGKGGGLTGQAALAALLEAVPTGKVDSAELLPEVAKEMTTRAAHKLDIARETSQAWQDRLGNQRTAWSMIASESGLEEGQRNFFRFFTQWMNENKRIPEMFGEFWNGLSKQFAIAGGFGGLLKEVLGGEDNIISEWLGPERTEQFRSDMDKLGSAALKAAQALGFFAPDAPQPGLGQEPKYGEAGYGRKTFWQAGAESGQLFARMLVAAGEGDWNSDQGAFASLGGGVANLMDWGLWNHFTGGYARGRVAKRLQEERWEVNNRLAAFSPEGRDVLDGLTYQRPNTSSLTGGDIRASIGGAHPVQVGSITIYAESSEPEKIKEALEDYFSGEGLGANR